MKGIAAAVLMLLILLLAGCQSEPFSLSDGRYVLEQSGADGISLPYLLVNDGRMAVIQDIAISYQPSGTLEISGNEVALETSFRNEPCNWSFTLTDNNRLTFSSEGSNLPSHWESWENGSVFILAQE